MEPVASALLFLLSHAMVLTGTASQGRTMRAGFVIGCERMTTGAAAKDDGEWWLELYVMLSRATRLDDLLLIRAPPSTCLTRGPPTDVKERLQKFARQTQICREEATGIAKNFGFACFLH